uniref:Uncharacterized protein n=1 Tax=Anopheles epiroticus TaxID=199890 RepID=A0A182PUT2_9DIPT
MFTNENLGLFCTPSWNTSTESSLAFGSSLPSVATGGLDMPSAYFGFTMRVNGVLAAPHEGFTRLLQDPSNVRYGLLGHWANACCKTTANGVVSVRILVGGVRNLDGRRVGQRLGGGGNNRGSVRSIGLDGRGSIGGVDGSRSSMSVGLDSRGSIGGVDGSRGSMGVGGHSRGGSIGNLLGQDGLGISVLGQLVGDAGVRLADARERGVNGLGVVGDGTVVRADRALVRGTDSRAGHDGLSDRSSSVHLRSGVDLRGGIRDGLGDRGGVRQLGRSSLRDGAVAHRRCRRVVRHRGGVLDGMASLQVSSASDGQRSQENDELRSKRDMRT